MPSFKFDITIPVDEQTVNFIEAAAKSPLINQGTGGARPCETAEKATILMVMPDLRAGVLQGLATLDVFVWDVILSELARYNLGPAKGNDDVLWTFWAIRQAMHADERYLALLRHAKDYERKQKKVERIRKRHERDRRILNAYCQSHNNPVRALEAAN